MLRGLSQYRLLRQLGSGGQGRVFLALDTLLQRRVAIKIYHLQGGIAQRRQAVREARQLALIDSERVVRIFDVVRGGDSLALVEQYVPGCDLEEFLADQKRLPLEDALRVMTDVAAALTAVHRNGNLHGDLKASNVLLTTEGRALVCDLGVTTVPGELAAGVSTDAMSPEQSRGEAPEQRSDLFAAGMLFYRMLYGRNPFLVNGRLDHELLRRGLSHLPPLAATEPAAAAATQALLRQLLAGDPARRPATTVELRKALRELRRQLPAATGLSSRILRVARSEKVVRTVPELPRALISPPLVQRFAVLLRHLWSRGSDGARAAILLTGALVVVLITAYIGRPGPCLSIATAQVKAPAHILRALPAPEALEAGMLLALRRGGSRAQILGRMPGSDSAVVASEHGVRERCIAERQLALRVECDRLQCLLDLQASHRSASRHEQLVLPVQAGLAGFSAAVAQLTRAQSAFLLAD